MDVAAVATRVLMQVLEEKLPLTQALVRQREQLSDPQRLPLLQELCYGTLRFMPRLEAVMELLLARPLPRLNREVACLLATGLYRLEHMNISDHAAVNLTVEGCSALRKPWARGLINATLRRYLRERERIKQRLRDSQIARHAHPAWLIAAIRQAWPQDWEQILETGNTQPPLTLRVNRRRGTRQAYQQQLWQQGIRSTPVPHCPCALLLHEAVPVARLPGFSAGAVSVQDAAAQLGSLVLDATPGERVLDACAAPGGKAGAILEQSPGVKLWCLDRAAPRLERVRENLHRLGLHALLVAGDLLKPGDWWDGQHFDRILLDTPCSATGVIRRNPDIKLVHTPDDIAGLATLQTLLLTAAWALLKPGGRLVYASCSILPAENTRPVGDFLRQHADACVEPIRAPWGRSCGPGRQILPGWQNMDGFYYASLHKTCGYRV